LDDIIIVAKGTRIFSKINFYKVDYFGNNKIQLDCGRQCDITYRSDNYHFPFFRFIKAEE